MNPRTEREDLITQFYNELKPSYDKYQALKKSPRRLTIRQVAVKTAHLKREDLYYLKSICESAKREGGSYSKVFWGSLKI